MTDPIFIIFASGLGLIIGSFLNVLIYRGPSLWGLIEEEPSRGSLWGPRSVCTNCRNQIKGCHNIPILSYVLLKGKCAQCNIKISLRYPVVELLGAVAAGISVIVFGWSWLALAAACFFWILIALAFIDYETGYLPNALTFPLIFMGLLVNGFSLLPFAPNTSSGFVTFPEAVIGALSGYIGFWLIAFYYKRLRGRDGLGLGDAKLLAALGAWLGWLSLAPLVLVASLSALLFVGIIKLSGKEIDASSLIRFGPALTLAGALVFLANHI